MAVLDLPRTSDSMASTPPYYRGHSSPFPDATVDEDVVFH